MKPELIQEKLVNEIIEEFRLPRTTCEQFILDRIAWAYAAGYEQARNTMSSAKPVVQMDVNGVIIKTWESAAAAARHYQVDKSSIAKAAKNFHKHAQDGFKSRYKDIPRHTCAGYRWRYAQT